MDRVFLIEGFKVLLPITFVFSMIFGFGIVAGDYTYHFANYGQMIYPPFTSWLLGFLGGERAFTIFILNLFVSTIIPYLLIIRITGKQEAGFVYLFSGIPYILFVAWLIPQAIIQIFMLAAILNPLGLLLFALGPWVHHEWLAAFALTTIYIIITRFRGLSLCHHFSA